jgi:hypothetical protein
MDRSQQLRLAAIRRKGHEGQRRRISRARMDLDTSDLDEMERELGTEQTRAG